MAYSSDEDDIFTRGGGVRNHVSIYDKLGNGDLGRDSDDSDEGAESLKELARRQKSRGRSLKRKRTENITNKSSNDDKAHKKKKTSVFDTLGSDSDDIEVVTVKTQRTRAIDLDADDDNYNPLLTDDDDDDDDDDAARAARRALEQARRVVEQADEGRIVQEAEREAREEMLKIANLRKKEIEAEAIARARKENTQKSAQAVGRPIVLKVRCGKQMEKKMRIKTTSPLLMVVKPFCDEFKIDSKRIVMEIDGEIVQDGQTADDYELDDGFVVDLALR